MKERNQAFRIVKLFGKAVAVAICLGVSVSHAQTVTVSGSDQNITTNPMATPAINFLSNNGAFINSSISITGVITTSAVNQGWVTVGAGRSVIFDSQIGTSTNPLAAAQAFGSSFSRFNQMVYAETFRFELPPEISLPRVT